MVGRREIPLDEDHRVQAFIDWLCVPPKQRQPHSQALFAQTIGVHERTLVNWKQDKHFRQMWQARVGEVIGDPTRAKEVLDALFFAARDPGHRNHVQAARLYLEATDAIKPKKIEVSVSKEAEKLSDAELDALIALGAAELKAARHGDT